MRRRRGTRQVGCLDCPRRGGYCDGTERHVRRQAEEPAVVTIQMTTNDRGKARVADEVVGHRLKR